jgi:predicted small secreted protein
MDATLRRLRALIAIALACAATTLPACGTMGGGGMKYLAEPSSAAGEVISS